MVIPKQLTLTNMGLTPSTHSAPDASATGALWLRAAPGTGRVADDLRLTAPPGRNAGVKERQETESEAFRINVFGAERELNIPIACHVPVGPEELERRGMLFDKIMSTRAQMEPVSADVLLRDVREEADRGVAD